MEASARASRRRPVATEGVVATKALMRAASRLGISNKVLGRIVGLSEASVSRMGAGAFTLSAGDKSFELALLFIRLFRALDAVTGGDDAVASAWVRNDNLALGAAPLTLVQSVSGLTHVLGYVDSRRALA